MEDLELLKAILAVAVADGHLHRAEKGVLAGLAKRVGVGPVTFDAMLEAARTDKSFVADIDVRSTPNARRGLKLLVGTARIDGHISEEERSLIVDIALKLGITGEEFEKVYLEGIAQADTIRRKKA